MTPLASQIIRRIAATGPLSVAEYMNECLLHPQFGYYTTRDPLGAHGDFTTAPEISQMFGELLGLCLAQSWLDRGAPRNVNVVELGPGRGTLMADLLRTTRSVPGFHDALCVHLVEASPALRMAQTATIGRPITHHDSLDTLPEGPVFVIANEFFDALPIRQFQRHGAGWRERLVGVQDGVLTFGLSEPTRPAFLDHRLGDTCDGEIVEVSPATKLVAATLGARIAAQGGVALIVDYGGWRSLGDTLQAVRAHQPVDPLATPGEADLTAHVDFETIARAARPAAATAMVPQGVLLELLGITARARRLAERLDGAALDAHVAAHRRLTHPDEMGTLFKAMALYQTHTPPPPGFEPA